MTSLTLVLALVVLLGVAVLGGGLWVAVCLAIAWGGGWRSLASRFAVPALPPGPSFAFQSGGIRSLSGYRSTLTVVVTESGVGVHPLFLFRVGHAPLFLPFSAMTGVTRERILWRTGVRMQLDDQSVTLVGSSVDAICAAWEAARERGGGMRQG